MKTKVSVQLSKKIKNESGSGCFGSYYQVSKHRGLKVLATAYDTVRELLTSSTYSDAKQEYKILKRLRNSKFTPKPYGIKIIQEGQEYKVGILMQHLGNRTLSSTVCSERRGNRVSQMLLEVLEHYGIVHKDLHWGNIMVKTVNGKKQYFAIDFTPEYIDVLA